MNTYRLTSILLLIFLSSNPNTVFGQCPPLVCQNIVNVTLGSDGTLDLDPELFLSDAASSNCAFAISPASVDCSNIGDTLSVTILDWITGSTCSSSVVVDYSADPLHCKSVVNVTLGSDGTLELDPELFLSDSASSNCAFAISPASVDCSNIGDTLSVTILDWITGSTCSSSVVVDYSTDPLHCKSIVNVTLGSDGTLDLDPELFLSDAASSNCAFAISPASVDCSNIGDTLSVTILDWITGSTCSSSVVVDYSTDPLHCKSVVNVTLGSDGTLDLDPELFLSDAASSNCTYAISPASVDCSNIGDTLSVTILDWITGSTCSSSVVVDYSADPLHCKSVVNVTLVPDGTLDLDPELFLSDAASSNCAYAISPASVDCSDIGKTLSVTIIDWITGNTCSSSVVVENPKPTSVDIDGPLTITCGESGAVFDANITGGYGPFSYDWSIKGKANGWSISGGQGTGQITMDVGTKKIKLNLVVTDVCGKKIKRKVTLDCNSPNALEGANIALARKSILDKKDSKVSIFPNPVMNHLNVSFAGEFEEEESEILIVDQFGNIVNKYTNTKNRSNEAVFDLSGLSSGIYWIIVQSVKGNRHVELFVKI